MTRIIYLATNTGLVICGHKSNEWRIVDHVLKDRHMTSVIAREGVILAGTTTGVLRSDDGGARWRAVNQGLTHKHIRWLAYHPDIADLEFAGTEPAGIYLSRDGGEHWTERPEVSALRDRCQWMLPYSPEAGCVRGFAFHSQRAYAAVEVGGVLRSDNGGATWALVEGSDGNPDLSGPPEPMVYPDVHDIAIHPSDPDLVVAATGAGLYRSGDGGKRWELLYQCYCRGLWLDPDDPEHIIFGPADYVGSVGRIEATRDGGQSWQLASDGLIVPWPYTMPERFCAIDDTLFAVLADGRLLAAPLQSLQWAAILANAGELNAVTSMGE